LKYNTDNTSYREENSGCYLASSFRGKPSSCLECPFSKKCVYDETLQRQREIQDMVIITMAKRGMINAEIAKALGYTIWRVDRVTRNFSIMLLAENGKSDQEIAKLLSMNTQTVNRIRQDKEVSNLKGGG